MNKPRLLIVEDEAIVAADLNIRLTQLGYQVAGTATSGEQALALAEQFQPDLVLMDIRLQGAMDGIEAARKLRTGYRLPVVFLTAYAESATLHRAKMAEPFGYILKPFEDRELETTIEMALYKHQSERKLEESERRFHSLVDGIPSIAVQGYDRNRRVLFWNAASVALYGYTREEALGRQLEDLIIPPAMREAVIAAVTHWVTNGVPIPAGELVLQKKDGQPISVFSSHTMLVNTQGEPELFCIDIDLTERKRAEAEKAKLEAQFQQTQKMESVGRLAGGVAHDFNNMLQAILINVDLALRDIPSGSPLRETLNDIQNCARRSANLTRQLLAFARQQTIAPKVLDLNEAVEGLLKMLRRLIGENIHLAWLPAAGLGPIKMDPTQLDQILANLCLNARDAIREVGRITIETGSAVFDVAYCAEHPGCLPGAYVLLAVTDDGSGMDQTTLAHLFEPFFTTKGVGEGTGLGLATVYGIVKQNHGFLQVDSAPDHGAAFKIYLPRHADPEVTFRTETKGELPVSTGETMLLVEDEPAILTIVQSGLERLGYTVLAATRPGEAIRLAEAHRGEIQLLMTDVVMPEMNGRELANRVLSLHPKLKCLFMSGYTADVIAHHGVLEDCVHFIQKPFSLEALAAKVRATLDGCMP